LRTVDVILPFHRNDEYLQIAINSLLNSRGVVPRIIFVDDRIDDKPLGWKGPENSILVVTGGIGYSQAVRRGVEESTSEFVAFIDSDDITHPNRISTQISKMEEFKADLSCCSLYRINQHGRRTFLQSPQVHGISNFELPLLLGSFNANSSWVVRRNLLKDRNFLNPNYLSIDWASALNLFGNIKIVSVDSPLYGYRRHGGQLTGTTEYLKDSWHQIYPLWQRVNQKYSLPILNESEAANLAAPWRYDFVQSPEFYEWIESFLGVCLEIDPEAFGTLNNIVNFRMIQNFLKSSEKSNLLSVHKFVKIAGYALKYAANKFF
jgi:glycosyltransferase involved in cell wall biosynthesis